MVKDLKDCSFKRILIIGSVVKYRWRLAVALMRLLDRPEFSAIDPARQNLPQHGYAWSQVDLIIVDMSEHKAAIRNWYFDLVMQAALPVIIFMDRSATVDDAADMVRAGGSDYIDITRLSLKRLTRALLIAANMHEVKSGFATKSASTFLPLESGVTASLVSTIKSTNKPTGDDSSVRQSGQVLSGMDNMTDEPTEVLPRLNPSTLDPVVFNVQTDDGSHSRASGRTGFMRTGHSGSIGDEDGRLPETTGSGKHHDHVGVTDEVTADYQESHDSLEASFVTTGLMSILDRANLQQAALPEDRDAKAKSFTLGQYWPFTPQQIERGEAIIDNYRILEFVAIGGMVSVFKVQHKDTGQISAMKLFDRDTSDRLGRKRFIRGYQLIEKVSHRHVVAIQDLVASEESAYAVMEYFPAGDLKKRISKGINRKDIVHYTTVIAAALDTAHQQNILHRDLKPSNVMFRANGDPVLLDFGIAKLMTESRTSLAFSDHVVGTPYYISPEQAVGSPLDGRSDLYALGIMLYEMIEGEHPYSGDSPMDIMRQHVSGPVPRLTSVTDPLDRIIGKLLSKDRDDRYATGREVIRALLELVPESIDDD